jgi:hypothetical protein
VAEVDDGDEGELSKLEPDAFERASRDDDSDSESGAESDKETGPDLDAEEHSGSDAHADADDYLNNGGWLWQD